MTVQLQPESVGTVTVRMTLRDGALDIRMDAQRPSTMALLRADQDLVTQVVRAAGGGADHVSVTISDRAVQAGQARPDVQMGPDLGARGDGQRTPERDQREPGPRSGAFDKTHYKKEGDAPRLAVLLFAAAASISDPVRANAPAEGLCERQMALAAERHDVPLGVLYAVGLTETGRKGRLHPHAMNIEGRSLFPDSAAEAEAAFRRARAQGKRLIDLGCMQINHHYHGERFSSLAAMLDPAENVDYAARFLARLKVREGSWTMAVARYHAGPDNNPAQKRYVCAVIRNLVATGFGAWSPSARRFCGAP